MKVWGRIAPRALTQRYRKHKKTIIGIGLFRMGKARAALRSDVEGKPMHTKTRTERYRRRAELRHIRPTFRTYIWRRGL